jgi:hypothetical protein
MLQIPGILSNVKIKMSVESLRVFKEIGEMSNTIDGRFRGTSVRSKDRLMAVSDSCQPSKEIKNSF